MAPLEWLFLRRERRALCSGLSGRVLDLGAGTGANFPFFPAGCEVTALEPDARQMERARQRGEGVCLIEGRAEALPFSSESFDHVVCALVLCSVEDVAQSLAEAHRVLAPGGRLHFLEHVRGGFVHDLLAPVWRRLTGGCCLNRRTVERIREAGFEVLSVGPVASVLGVPFVRGVARRRLT